MLPNLKTAATAGMLSFAIAAAPVNPALAWGEKEQNFLAGVLATIAVGTIINETRKSDRATRSYATPVYRQPQYDTRYRDPSYDRRYRTDDRSRIPSYGSPYYGSSASAAHSAFLNYSPSMRRSIQARLSDFGYYNGAIDGVWGPRTEAALRAYAADQGLSDRLRSYTGAVAVLDNLAA